MTSCLQVLRLQKNTTHFFMLLVPLLRLRLLYLLESVMIFHDARSKNIELGQELREELDKRLAAIHESTEADTDVKSTNSSCNAPTPIAILFDYIISQFKHKRSKAANSKSTTVSKFEAIENYHEFFPTGQCIFAFPPDPSENPSPFYHSIVGPNYPSNCCKCGCRLTRYRSNFSHNKTLFPVFKPNGRIVWGCVMNYDCGGCNSRYAANDAVLLASLPAHIRATYPVEPRYENGAYHFTIQATDELEPLFKMYANGDFYSKKLYEQ